MSIFNNKENVKSEKGLTKQLLKKQLSENKCKLLLNTGIYICMYFFSLLNRLNLIETNVAREGQRRRKRESRKERIYLRAIER